ncbi:MAG: ABC transporter ATP-binding protein [bacterium]
MLVAANLQKTFQAASGAVQALRDVSFEVKRGQSFALLGPSGCGKTTTLRCIAGLERLDGGQIQLDGQVVNAPDRRIHAPPYERPIGMVFQSYAIWPHMTVFENVAYPLTVGARRLSGAARADRVMEALRLVKMEALASRPAPQLSGGQQQRVALARALVAQPKLLLLDEPLSNLDAKLREQMREELRSLVSTLGITSLYVTHDQIEALAMSDRVAVMEQGVIVQEGTPRDIYARPQHRFVADFVGAANFFEGTLSRVSDDGLGVVALAGGTLLACRWPRDGAGVPSAERVVVVVRPEDITISRRAPEREANAFEAQVEQVAFLGSFVEVLTRASCGAVRVRAHPAEELRQGERVFLSIRPDACKVLDLGGGG